jgi:hypothetical protein
MTLQYILLSLSFALCIANLVVINMIVRVADEGDKE